MWFIGVEAEQQTSAAPPNKNPGSAPAFLDRFFPGAHVPAEMSLQVILLFERVFNNQNQSCFLIIC